METLTVSVLAGLSNEDKEWLIGFKKDCYTHEKYLIGLLDATIDNIKRENIVVQLELEMLKILNSSVNRLLLQVEERQNEFIKLVSKKD